MYLNSEFETALNAIDLEIKNNPENLEAWGTKATLLLKLAELTDEDESQKSYYLRDVIQSATTALQKESSEVRLWDLLATAHIRLSNLQKNQTQEENELKKALYAIEQALTINKNLAGFWFVKALVYDRLNDKKKAALAFNKSTLLKPEFINELPEEYKNQQSKN